MFSYFYLFLIFNHFPNVKMELAGKLAEDGHLICGDNLVEVKPELKGTHLDFNDGTQPFHRRTNGAQPSKTIVTNGCLIPKPSENH